MNHEFELDQRSYEIGLEEMLDRFLILLRDDVYGDLTTDDIREQAETWGEELCETKI